jgi:uncharacterized membrane protein (DUF4010 family)
MPSTAESLQSLAVALLVGLLIGLDRERAELRKKRELFAGIRTFPLIAMLGAALTLVRAPLGPWPVIAGFLAVAGISLVSYARGAGQGDMGATTEVAALGAFALGSLAGVGQLVVAGAAGVAVAVLLAVKPSLERVSRALSEAEITAVLELAVISAIVLPLVPDRGYGPWDVLNPFRIWMVVVLVSAVSFAGFIAVRWKGEGGGLFWAAGLGGLVSSTAVTMAMAQRSRESPEAGRAIAAGAILATSVMCGRLLVLVAAAGPSLLSRVVPPVGAMAVTGLLWALLLRRGAPERPENSTARQMSNPFSLRSAMIFGAVFAGALLLVRGCEALFGSKGSLIAALLSGFLDVDAVSIALARGARPDSIGQATAGIVIACASNNLFKSLLALTTGAGSFRWLTFTGLSVMSALGGLVATLLAWGVY